MLDTMPTNRKVGDYVKTPKYGNGEIVDIEFLNPHYTGRFGVKLDDPSKWVCTTSVNKGVAYFYSKDIRKIKRA
jgi:hypothetical protein